MSPIQGSFDASQFAPKQMGTIHPVGKFPAKISNTSIEQTKDQTGGMFIVEFTTQQGSIVIRYNIWNQSAKAVEIAHGQLSALCHATGIFKLDWQNDGAALRGANCQIDVGYQKGEEPTSEKPAGGYTEVKKVYDANGNEPGKPPMQQAAINPNPTTQQQPLQQGNGGWGGAPQQGQAAPNSAPAWGGQPAPAAAPAQQAAPQGWSQQPPANKPPWAN